MFGLLDMLGFVECAADEEEVDIKGHFLRTTLRTATGSPTSAPLGFHPELWSSLRVVRAREVSDLGGQNVRDSHPSQPAEASCCCGLKQLLQAGKRSLWHSSNSPATKEGVHPCLIPALVPAKVPFHTRPALGGA
mmetsp:Transcript_12352/g.29440  ORF Transcript_12352/g.29440 Transcript_12352/m.29440 type:complete len:135 (-) Transcript_12352:82-486(-)